MYQTGQCGEFCHFKNCPLLEVKGLFHEGMYKQSKDIIETFPSIITNSDNPLPNPILMKKQVRDQTNQRIYWTLAMDKLIGRANKDRIFIDGKPVMALLHTEVR